MLASSLDKAGLIPGAYRPAYGEESSARYLGEVLASDREGDLDTARDLIPGVFGATQQNMSDARLGALCGQFAHTGLLLNQPVADSPQHILCDAGTARYQGVPKGLFPDKHDAFGKGDRRPRIFAQSDGHGDAEYLAWDHEAKNDLLPFGRCLKSLYMAVKQYEKSICLCALPKYYFVLFATAHASMA
jgi:hypothetical protein